MAGPVLDMNGNPVPDGTTVSFSLTSASGAASSGTGKTVDGLAGAAVQIAGKGTYGATASVGGITSETLAITVGSTAAPPPEHPANDDGSSGGSSGLLKIALPAALTALFVGVVGAAYMFRQRRAAPRAVAAPLPEAVLATSGVAVALGGAAEAATTPAALEVNVETRRVYVLGNEAKPGLSNEQFRLLSYLYERRGKVVARDELVAQVWPDVHAEGVSEEALDALVRRVRERIVQAGGERGYIVTLRGQGFRLEV